MGILTQPVTGWRRYDVVMPHFLSSSDTIIMPRERAESWCRGRYQQLPGGKWGKRAACEAGPEAECTCGFYAFDTFERWAESEYAREGVVAEVWMWGRTHVHQKGLRAQFTYPKALYAWGRKAETVMLRMGQEYLVPVARLENAFPEWVSRILRAQATRDAMARAKPPTEQELFDRALMGDAAATKTLRARLSSAICTRRKSIVRQEEQLKRTKLELQIKIAQRDGLRRQK